MKKLRNNSGFTLLEIIIVVIIVGVLASLALPRLFSTVEFSRGTEAMAVIGTMRSAMERCLLRSGSGDYVNCDTIGEIDIPDPDTTAGAHFTYRITNNGTIGYTITAWRGTLDGGTATDRILVTVDEVANTITRSGTGAFSRI